MEKIQIEPWLLQVSKPSRYIDEEINAVHKPWQKVNFCFVYPDVYEVGISNLGLKILYSIVNCIEGVMADRCYLPWIDMIEIMHREKIPLFALESRKALRDFDLLGFTLQSEITYSNVLEALDLAGIPVLAKDRGEEYPIIMAGGPCAINPLPLQDFIDVFFIGEAEKAICEIAEIFKRHSEKEIKLQELANIEGCYVPEIHSPLISQGWKVKARKFKEFSQSDLIHKPQILPWQIATHHRCVAELMRGCSRGCRFCQAGYFYRPIRERSADILIEDVLSEIKESGWDEAGLLSLSSSDYSQLKDVLRTLLNSIDTNKTHISLPSLRVDALDSQTIELMRQLGREGLTLAPEAGSQRLRDIINKNLTEEQILTGVKLAQQLGWQKVKLYFMIGLPEETDDDIDAIIELIKKIQSQSKNRMQINVTLSPFVPKPFTPFQWSAMLPRDELLNRCTKIKQAFKRSGNIKIKYHTIESSILEAIFARGDGKIDKVIFDAWKSGAYYDGWNECFKYELWEKAFQENGLSPEEYLQAKNLNEVLSWDFIDLGINKEFLLEEWRKAQEAITTPDCRQTCSQCGVCTGEIKNVISSPLLETERTLISESFLSKKSKSDIQYRYRVFYVRTDIQRFISHLDWMRMLFRLVSKAPLETVFTQGFSPHPKISLCPPLPLGVESICEYFDISFYSPYTQEDIINALSLENIPGYKINKAERLIIKPRVPFAEWISIKIPQEYISHIESSLSTFEKEVSHPFIKIKENKSTTYDLKKIILKTYGKNHQLFILKSLESPALYDMLAELLRLDKTILYTLSLCRIGWSFL